jgi:molybdenum cofactor synthesis domain-containing protein
MVVTTAAALLIGNELLSGKVHEANLVELAKTLRGLGVALTRVVMIPDDPKVIADEVLALSNGFDIVFTSGGVGPTHDDVTIESIASAFGVDAHIDETMAALLRTAYGDRITDAHLRMALVPRGAEMVTTEEVAWPTVVMKNVWILPGVPEIFRMKLLVVRECVKGPREFVSRAVFTLVEETRLKPWLDVVVAAHPKVEIGSYPKWFDSSYKTKITFDGMERATVDEAVEQFVSLVPPEELAKIE